LNSQAARRQGDLIRAFDRSLYARSNRKTCLLLFSPASWTIFTDRKPAFLKARKDLKLLSSGSVN
jgi:hypothetical protein